MPSGMLLRLRVDSKRIPPLPAALFHFQFSFLFQVIKGSGCFSRHAREGGHPVDSVSNPLDSCLRSNDLQYRNKFPDGSGNCTEVTTNRIFPKYL